MKNDILIGKVVDIVDRDSWYWNEWGVIRYFDGDYYHVAIADGEDCPIFEKWQFRVRK